MDNFTTYMTESKARLSDKDLTNSIQKLIDNKTINIEHDTWYKIKWDDNPSSIFLADNQNSKPKTWQDGFLEIVNGKGFAITVWDGIPKALKKAIQNANMERKKRIFDKDEELYNKRWENK